MTRRPLTQFYDYKLPTKRRKVGLPALSISAWKTQAIGLLSRSNPKRGKGITPSEIDQLTPYTVPPMF